MWGPKKRIKQLPARLTISLDQESLALIEHLQQKYKTSKADIVRKAVFCLDIVEKVGVTSTDTIKVWLDFLGKGEHVIVDVEHWRAIFKEIGRGSEEFWEKVREIGKHHWDEYYDKGLRTVREILEYVEKTNWYKLSVDSERGFTLVLNVREAKRFIRNFFEGLFEMSPHKVSITETDGKLRINVMA